MVVATTPFAALAHSVAEAIGMPNARVAVVEHPLGGVDEDAIRARADAVIDDVVALMTAPGGSR